MMNESIYFYLGKISEEFREKEMVALGLQELACWCRKSGRRAPQPEEVTYTKARGSGHGHPGWPCSRRWMAVGAGRR